jgi:hypothetical protein
MKQIANMGAKEAAEGKWQARQVILRAETISSFSWNLLF